MQASVLQANEHQVVHKKIKDNKFCYFDEKEGGQSEEKREIKVKSPRVTVP